VGTLASVVNHVADGVGVRPAVFATCPTSRTRFARAVDIRTATATRPSAKGSPPAVPADASTAKAQRLSQRTSERRLATRACFADRLLAEADDDVIDVLLIVVHDLASRSERAVERDRIRTAGLAAPLGTSSQGPAVTPSPGDPAGEPGVRALPASYVVVPGDTLSAIAERFLGDANLHVMLLQANGDQLSDADTIRTGQILRIPALAQE